MSRPYKFEDGDLLVAKETDQGTTATPDRRLGLIEDSVSLPDPAKEFEENYFVGAGRKPATTFEGQTELSGNIQLKPVDTLPFEMLLGASATSSTGTDTINIPQKGKALSVTLQSILSKSDTELVRTYSGVVSGSGEISVDSEDELVVDMDIDALSVSKEVAKGSATQDIINQPTWSFLDTQSNLNLFGVSFSRLNDFTLEINQNTTVEYYVESSDNGNPTEILLGNAEITLSPTITVAKNDIYNELLNGNTEFTSTIAFDNGSDLLQIEVQGCRIREADHDIPDEGTVETDVEIVGRDVVVTFNP
jgi:hypothetical protein